MLKALRDFKLTQASSIKVAVEDVRVNLAGLRERLPDSDKPVPAVMERLVAGLVNLCEWVEHSLRGEENAGRFLTAAHAQAVVALEQLGTVRHQVFAKAAGEIASELKSVTSLEHVTLFASKLMRLPVPIIMLQQSSARRRIRQTDDSPLPTDVEGPFVIKVVFEVERRPWRTPQLLRANTIYGFVAQVTIPHFPKNCDYLLIDYISTLSPQQYRMTHLKVDKPARA